MVEEKLERGVIPFSVTLEERLVIRVHVLHVLVLQLQLREIPTQFANERAGRENNGDALLSKQLIQLVGLHVRQLVSVISR